MRFISPTSCSPVPKMSEISIVVVTQHAWSRTIILDIIAGRYVREQPSEMVHFSYRKFWFHVLFFLLSVFILGDNGCRFGSVRSYTAAVTMTQHRRRRRPTGWHLNWLFSWSFRTPCTHYARRFAAKRRIYSQSDLQHDHHSIDYRTAANMKFVSTLVVWFGWAVDERFGVFFRNEKAPTTASKSQTFKQPTCFFCRHLLWSLWPS